MYSFQQAVCSIYKKKYNTFIHISIVKKALDILFPILVDEKKQINRLFLKSLKYRNSLSAPKTFNEKLQWLKLNDRSKRHTICADKLLVRNYVKKQIGQEFLIPLLYKTQKVSDINLKNISSKSPCIIKTNHNSGICQIIKPEQINTINWKGLQKKFKKSLSQNFYFKWFEYQYKDITPYIIVEKLLLDNNQKTPNDYKFHCFHGEVCYIQVDIEREINHKRNIYDTKWQLCDFRIGCENGPEQETPKNLMKMMSIASKLSSEFYYARVDLYNIDGQIFFGEITFHPGAGFRNFIPQKADLLFGQKMSLPV